MNFNQNQISRVDAYKVSSRMMGCFSYDQSVILRRCLFPSLMTVDRKNDGNSHAEI